MNWKRIARKMRTPWGVVPVLLLLVLAMGGFWFFSHFEKKEFEIRKDVSPAARKNPLLAAQKYLQATGQPAESLEGMDLFTKLPLVGDAIVVRHLPGGLSKSINDNLIAWAESGGHLLLIPNTLDSDNPENGNILEQLGVRFQEVAEDPDCGCPPEEGEEKGTTETSEISEGDSEERTDGDAEIIEEDVADEDGGGEEADAEEFSDEDDIYRPYNSIITLNLDSFPIQFETFYPTLLEDKDQMASYRINGTYHIEYQKEEDQARDDNYEETVEDGAWLLQYTLGAGKVTVLSEMDLFYNSHIGNYDHAFFLSWLLQDADQVWLLYASNMDSLLTILWEKNPRFWIALFILLLLTLWRLQRQGGTLLRPEYVNRHNIIPHIEASGMYNWQVNKLSTMIEENRKNVLHRVADRFFGVGREQVKMEIDRGSLEAKTGISENELNTAFWHKIDNEQDLIQTTRALQRIQTRIQSGESTRNDSE